MAVLNDDFYTLGKTNTNIDQGHLFTQTHSMYCAQYTCMVSKQSIEPNVSCTFWHISIEYYRVVICDLLYSQI